MTISPLIITATNCYCLPPLLIPPPNSVSIQEDSGGKGSVSDRTNIVQLLFIGRYELTPPPTAFPHSVSVTEDRGGKGSAFATTITLFLWLM